MPGKIKGAIKSTARGAAGVLRGVTRGIGQIESRAMYKYDYLTSEKAYEEKIQIAGVVGRDPGAGNFENGDRHETRYTVDAMAARQVVGRLLELAQKELPAGYNQEDNASGKKKGKEITSLLTSFTKHLSMEQREQFFGDSKEYGTQSSIPKKEDDPLDYGNTSMKQVELASDQEKNVQGRERSEVLSPKVMMMLETMNHFAVSYNKALGENSIEGIAEPIDLKAHISTHCEVFRPLTNSWWLFGDNEAGRIETLAKVTDRQLRGVANIESDGAREKINGLGRLFSYAIPILLVTAAFVGCGFPLGFLLTGAGFGLPAVIGMFVGLGLAGLLLSGGVAIVHNIRNRDTVGGRLDKAQKLIRSFEGKDITETRNQPGPEKSANIKKLEKHMAKVSQGILNIKGHMDRNKERISQLEEINSKVAELSGVEQRIRDEAERASGREVSDLNKQKKELKVEIRRLACNIKGFKANKAPHQLLIEAYNEQNINLNKMLSNKENFRAYQEEVLHDREPESRIDEYIDHVKAYELSMDCIDRRVKVEELKILRNESLLAGQKLDIRSEEQLRGEIEELDVKIAEAGGNRPENVIYEQRESDSDEKGKESIISDEYAANPREGSTTSRRQGRRFDAAKPRGRSDEGTPLLSESKKRRNLMNVTNVTGRHNPKIPRFNFRNQPSVPAPTPSTSGHQTQSQPQPGVAL